MTTIQVQSDGEINWNAVHAVRNQLTFLNAQLGESRLKCSLSYKLSRSKMNYGTLARIAVNGFISQLALLLTHRQW